MAKSKNILSYDPIWEELFTHLRDTMDDTFLFSSTFTRAETFDIRQTFYGYRKALDTARWGNDFPPEKRSEFSSLMTAGYRFQVHITPNPNLKENNDKEFEIALVRTSATPRARALHDSLKHSLSSQRKRSATVFTEAQQEADVSDQKSHTDVLKELYGAEPDVEGEDSA